MTSIRQIGWSALALTLFAVAGCGTQTPMTPVTPVGTPPPGPSVTKVLPVEPVTTKLSDAEIAEIKKLPAEDAKIALDQMVCPVSGDHLGEGSMGAPIKQVVEGKTFFLCCSGCEAKVKENPAAVLAKLKK